MLAIATAVGAAAKYLLDHLLARGKQVGEITQTRDAAADARRARELEAIFAQWQGIAGRLEAELKDTRQSYIDCVGAREKLSVECTVLRTEVERLQHLVEEQRPDEDK